MLSAWNYVKLQIHHSPRTTSLVSSNFVWRDGGGFVREYTSEYLIFCFCPQDVDSSSIPNSDKLFGFFRLSNSSFSVATGLKYSISSWIKSHTFLEEFLIENWRSSILNQIFAGRKNQGDSQYRFISFFFSCFSLCMGANFSHQSGGGSWNLVQEFHIKTI